jgi:hypothetical protein
MRDQETKLRKVKEILTKDSHSGMQPTRSAATLETKDIHTPLQLTRYAATQEISNIHSHVLLSQSSKRVRTPTPKVIVGKSLVPL